MKKNLLLGIVALVLIVVLFVIAFDAYNQEEVEDEVLNSFMDESNIPLGNEILPIEEPEIINNQELMELNIEVLQEGIGEEVVKAGDSIVVHYTGTLLDGTKFDSSVDQGTPFEFTIGQGTVIQGWEQGLLGMKVGEKRKLSIPSAMAYGEMGAGDLIPPNTDLYFEVELMEIK